MIEDAALGTLRFTHDGLRTVTRAGLGAAEAIELHRNAANALEARHGADESALAAHAAMIAHHFSAADQHGRACERFHMAARYARTRYAHAEAISLFRSTLDEWRLAALEPSQTRETDRGAMAGVREELGDVLSLVGRHADAREAFHLALGGTSAAIVRSRLRRRIGKTHEVTHEYEAALGAYDDAERELGDERSGSAHPASWWPEWIAIQIERVMVNYWLARTETLNVLVQRIKSAPIEAHAARERAQLFKGLVYMSMRRERYYLSEQTVRYSVERLLASYEWGDAAEILEARFMQGLSLLFAGRIEDSVGVLSASLPEAERRGDQTLLARFLAYVTVAKRRQGDVPGTAEAAARCVAAAKISGLTEYVATGHANLGWVAWNRGTRDEARRLCTMALDGWAGLPLVYPLQWLARLVLLALDIEDGAADRAVVHAAAMLDPRQQLLPPELGAALQHIELSGHAVQLAVSHKFL